MNLRGHAPLHHPGIQLAPLVDVLLLLLIFFLLTWNAARNENELDVKVPKASAATEKSAPIGDVVVNVKADGNVVVNRRTLSGPELTSAPSPSKARAWMSNSVAGLTTSTIGMP